MDQNHINYMLNEQVITKAEHTELTVHRLYRDNECRECGAQRASDGGCNSIHCNS